MSCFPWKSVGSCTLPRVAAVFAGIMTVSPALAQEPAPPPGEPVIVVRPLPPPPPLLPPEPSFSFTFSTGYARLESDGGDSLIDGEDGYYFDFDFAGRPNPHSPLWLGVGFGGSYFDQNDETQIDTGGVFPTFVEVDAALSLFTIEPRATFVLLPKQDKGLYVAGRIGAGLLIADYWATAIVERPAGIFVDGDGETTFAFEVRPAAQVGFCGGPWVVGAEVSQMWAWGDFDPLGDQLTETRLGVFFTFRY